MKEYFERIFKNLLNEEENRKISGIITYSVLGLVALVMTVMNIATSKGFLIMSTGIFAGLCLINIVITYTLPRGMALTSRLFAVEVLGLFSVFLISGNPDGFSSLWICMLPAFGLYFFGRRKGSLLCGLMLVIMVVLLWTPVGDRVLMYDYNATFRMRYPVLFVSYYLLSLFLESLRAYTLLEMNKTRQLYREQSIKDQLTGMLNRQGLYASLEDEKFTAAGTLSAVMIDIDFFKSINDTYGHAAGDDILKEVSAMFCRGLDTAVCRWGGEEFVAIFPSDVTRERLEAFRETVASHPFVSDSDTIRLTVSIGVCTENGADVKQIDALIEKADEALYEAKNTGRNRVVFFSDIPAKNN